MGESLFLAHNFFELLFLKFIKNLRKDLKKKKKKWMRNMELNSLQGNILVSFIKHRAKDKRRNGHICKISSRF